jgi:hypothetical protein
MDEQRKALRQDVHNGIEHGIRAPIVEGLNFVGKRSRATTSSCCSRAGQEERASVSRAPENATRGGREFRGPNSVEAQ